MKWAVFLIAAACGATALLMCFILLDAKKRQLLLKLTVAAAVVFVGWGAVMALHQVRRPAQAPKQTGKPHDSEPQISFAVPEGQVLTAEGNSPQIRIPTYNETGVDALDRRLPAYEEAGAPKINKYVGVFYLLWTADIKTAYDNTKLIAQNPADPRYGAYGSFHWWSEPETGYHRADDVWQIKRDLYYLSAAGVDFVYMDFTNGYIYEETFRLFLDTSLELRAQGIMTPYVVPWAIGTNQPGQEDIGALYRIFYTDEKYSDLWFYWEGKPLAMLKPELDVLADPAFTAYFTFRVAWTPDVTYPGQPENRWRWADNDIVNYGYAYGWDEDPEKAEFAGIGAAGFADPGQGRSGNFSGKEYLNQFIETDYTGEGLAFLQAFEEVMEKNPETEVLTISRWNEWVAQYLKVHEYGFVDQYNREFSRDFEPTKYGSTDNYYYLMCSVIRRFKGISRPDAVSAAKTISVDGSFAQWQDVAPVFYDYTGDTSERNHPDTSGRITYVNTTGRNDITESRFAYDSAYVYFYAKTAAPLSAYTDQNWMLLFIDADCDPATGWEGYDYLINYCVIDESRTVVCRYQNGLWQEIALTEYRTAGNELQIRVPRSVLGLTQETIEIGFHWLDNVTNLYSLYDWFTTGESAPERRNYYFVKASCRYTPEQESVLPARSDTPVLYMKPAEVAAETLQSGLAVQKYDLAEGYNRQPEIYLLIGRSSDRFRTDRIAADISNRTQGFALHFTGWIYVETDGYYTFTLRSDDGSVLSVDERTVVENTGVHTVQEASGTIGLCAGYHAVSLEYFDCGNGDAQLSLNVQGGEYAFYCPKEV